MQPCNIKSHNGNRHYAMPHFFVLSKGNNAGKPLDQPYPNCFVITTPTQQEKDRLYWRFASDYGKPGIFIHY